MTIFGLAESFKTMNRSDTAWSHLWRYLIAYFSESIRDWDVKFQHNYHSSLYFVLYKFGINIFDSLENIGFFGNVTVFSS